MRYVINAIRDAILRNNSIICCGLDPDIRKLPVEYRNLIPEEAIKQFLYQVIDITLPHIAAYKIQKAFFDMYVDGYSLLFNLITYIRLRDPNIPIILDSKIGDIDNTMYAYLLTLFSTFGVDAITLNPYMGSDVWNALKGYPDHAGLILVRTSNKNGSLIQDVPLMNGSPLWKYVLDLVITEWHQGSSIIPVLSDHCGSNLVGIRSIIPETMPIFFAGAGAQGANLECVHNLIDSQGCGVLVNSSRALLYPYLPDNTEWIGLIERSVITLKNQLNGYRL